MDISPRRSSLLHGCENSGKPAPDKGFRVTFPVQTGAVSHYNAFPEFGGGPLRSRFGSIHLCRLWFFLLATFTAAQTAEQRTARYFESVRKRPQLLLAFLKDLPKGGDLHNHLEGAIYAEDWVDFAAEDNLCVDRTTSRLIAPPCDSCESYTAKPAMRCAYGDHILYNQTIDAWSMRNWRRRRIARDKTICNTSSSCTRPTQGWRLRSQRRRNGPTTSGRCAKVCWPRG